MTLTNDLHLRQTSAFIMQNPITIVITRVKRIGDGKGGWKKDSPQTLDPQVVRKVGSTRVSGTAEITLPSGKVVVPSATLIAMPDADIQREDTFLVGTTKFEVAKVSMDPPWRLAADVVEQI